jgi:hypothetical protein
MKMKNENNKQQRLMNGVGKWASFYRENPHRLASDYLGIKWLRPFQQALIVACFKYTYVMIIASRGMGKSLIAALVCVLKCILYPGIKICIASGRRGQSLNVINKIVQDFMGSSDNLRNEILDYKVSTYFAEIRFKNGSNIKVVTASDSARSARANFILGDEFVQIKKPILDKVIRKFKAGQRTPRFFFKDKYKNYPKEPNTELYLSSAYYKYHYSFAKFKSFFKSMLKGDSYCVMGFPYQLPVAEGYYPMEQIRDELREGDFDSIGWSMEMDSLFFGESENAFYSFDELDNSRKITNVMYPKPFYNLLNDNKFKYPMKKNGEIRILSVDIATQGGNKRDATCFAILQLIPYGKNQFLRNLVYLTTIEGGHTFNQSLKARRLFYDFDCDYVVIDSQGVGIGVFDNLVQEQTDDTRNIIYPAWSCVNDETMADRCKDPDAPKIIYSIKANLQFNSDCAVSLRDSIRQGKFRLLINENEANEILNSSKRYNSLTVENQVLFQEPFYQTTALINEMVNLSFEVVNGKIRVNNQSGIRKDRFSAVSYANLVANEFERQQRAFQDEYEFQTFIN